MNLVLALVQLFQQTSVHPRANENTSRRPDIDVPSTRRKMLPSFTSEFRTKLFLNFCIWHNSNTLSYCALYTGLLVLALEWQFLSIPLHIPRL